MPFLKSSTGQRKKKSYFHDDTEESAKRRGMIKEKLNAQHMMMHEDDDDVDDYLRRVAPTSPVRRSRKMQVGGASPNYIDPSGPLRKPPRRTHSESTSRTSLSNSKRGPLRTPRRSMSHTSDVSDLSNQSPLSTTPRGNTRLSMASRSSESLVSQSPESRASQSLQSRLPPLRRASSRMSSHNNNNNNSRVDEDDEDESETGEEKLSPLGQRRPPRRRRRNTVSTQSLQKSADAALRFSPPRRIKSYYPGGHLPRNIATMNMDDGIDTSEQSYVSKNTSEKGTRKGLFRRKSNDFNATENMASSSDRSNSYYQNLKRSNSTLKKLPSDQLPKTSLHRAKGRQASKNAQNYMGSGNNKNINSHSKQISLSEQLSALPPSNDSDNEYDEIDEGESKSIFSSIISKIENIYDDLS